MINKPRDHSPTKSIAGLSLWGASKDIDTLNDQIKETQELHGKLGNESLSKSETESKKNE